MKLSKLTFSLILAASFSTTGCVTTSQQTASDHATPNPETAPSPAIAPGTAPAPTGQATTSQTAPQPTAAAIATGQSEKTACENANGQWLDTDICELQFHQAAGTPTDKTGPPKKPACEGFGDCAGQVLLGVVYGALMVPLAVLMMLGGGG